MDYSLAFAKASSSERWVQVQGDYWNMYGIVIDIDGTATYSNVVSVNLQSGALKLSAYPNLFGSSTTASYTLIKDERVGLSLYNVSGELVETIVDEKQQAGTYHQIITNKLLSNGVYYLNIRTGDTNAGITLIKN